MADEPNYYQTLGVDPTADQAAIDAAYQGKALRFRLGQLRDRARTLPGPSQEELEQAYAVLGNAESRALYDAAYFPDKATKRRRRVPAWVWGIAAVWVAVIAVVVVLGARSRLEGDDGPIAQIVGTATATAAPSVVAAAPPAETATETATPVPTAAPPTNTPAQVVAPTSTTAAPTATATLSTPSLTFRPTATEPPSPTATLAPTAAPSATVAPATATPEPPTATPEPPPPPTEPPVAEPPPAEPPPPEPTPTPSFRPTDRIGTTIPVNLRAGPGTNYAIVGDALRPGTLLAATGERTTAGGFLWRRFKLADGRSGWVRDVDVLPVR
jgi:hypothetical protein